MSAPHVEPDPQQRVLNLLRRYGRNVYSFMMLEPGLTYWFGDDGDSTVAFVDIGFHWIAVGAPICAVHRVADTAIEFARAAVRSGRRAAFFGSSYRLRQPLQASSGSRFRETAPQTH